MIDGNRLAVTLHDGVDSYVTLAMADEELLKKISEQGAVVSYGTPNKGSIWPWVLPAVLLFLVVLFFFSIKRSQSGMSNIFQLGKSKARLITDGTVTFSEVGGIEDGKEQLADVIDFLKNPDRWTSAGVRLPRGVMLVGPPGCGKTLLARAVAGEAGVPFFTLAASEFVELFVGVGAARVRDLFAQARAKAPAIVFVDEIDAVGRRRGSGLGTAHDEREQTLNELLASLDGFEPNDKVVVMAATNRPDVLDKALLRPGRFDRRIEVGLPSRDARLEMLRIHTRNKKLADDVSLEAIVEQTERFTGADIENLANEAALLAVRRTCQSSDTTVQVTAAEFDKALTSGRSEERTFNMLDSVLIESASQLAQPTGTAIGKCFLHDGTVVEGRVLWVDAKFIKVAVTGGDDILVAKSHVTKIEMPALADVVVDQWAHRMPDVM